MKALSMWQPWATLKACGAKKIETRSWATNYRGPILIHAAKKPLKEISGNISPDQVVKMLGQLYSKNICDRLADLPKGCIVGCANLVDCIEMTPEYINQQSETEILLGDWQSGRYAWVMSDEVLFHEPIPCKGFQGLWNYNGEVPEIKC